MEHSKYIKIYIRTSLISSLIGKSKYNRDNEAFTKLLEMNKTQDFSDMNDLDEIKDVLKNDVEQLNLIMKEYKNIIELQESINNIKECIKYELFLEKCKKYMICSFGKSHESNVLNKYIEQSSKTCIKGKLFKDMEIFKCKHFSIIITGTPDAITDNNEIIEIKNRIHSFSKSIKECDYIQLQTYLNIYNYQYGTLVEGMIIDENNGDININSFELERDNMFFKRIKTSLVKICVIVYKLLIDQEAYQEYLNKNDMQKCQFIYKHLKLINQVFDSHIIE